MNIRKAALAGIVTALLASTAYAHDPSGQNGGWMGGGYGMGPGMMGAGQDQMRPVTTTLMWTDASPS